MTPGIAIAEELAGRGHACSLVVSRKKVDARLIRNYPGLEFLEAPGAPFSWHPVNLVKFFWVQMTAFAFALQLLKRVKPDLILGFGGFLTAGIALPGYVKGVPFALHEANRVVGRSNRFLSRFADRVFLPEGIRLPAVKPDRIRFAGLPLRREFEPLGKEEARRRLGIRPSGKLLVVFGGSQGAGALNRWAEANLRRFAEKGVSLYCLTGLNKVMPPEVRTETQAFGTVTSWFVSFSDSMPAVLSAADAVVSRAGAGSIGEIIRCRVPAILIPYPFARDDHQTANAEYVADRGAARVLQETQLSTLFDEVNPLLFQTETVAQMRDGQSRLDRPEEARVLVDALQDLFPAEYESNPVPACPTET